MKYYTGIGSRSTPAEVGEAMEKIANRLDKLGYTLRSGAADGADTFFENGSKNKEIFIPWSSFGKGIVPEYSEFADDLLKGIHPAYNRLSSGAKKLHLRNINQVLGVDLDTPSDFLICWADVDNTGNPKGGTRTAWMLAKKYNIPCFNLYKEEDRGNLKLFLNNLENDREDFI